MAQVATPAGYDERARIRELLSLQILDTRPEERFDRYTRLVADIFEAPTVLLSLVDENRQWFKSKVGLDVCETARDVAFCAHALPLGYLEIPDAQADPRFRDNPLVTGAPYIRFYAGAVLHGPSGQPLGTLCVIDYQPRAFSPAERRRLQAFARLVEQELNVAARLHDLTRDLHRTAFYDAVTGLPGRWLIEEHLAGALDQARGSGERIAVMQLHAVNFDDTIALHGRAAGEALLQTLAERLQATIRASDRVGRVGADRFVLVMAGMRGAEAAPRIQALMQKLLRPIKHGEDWRPVRLAAGISGYPDDADSVEALLDRAKIALHRSAGGPEQRTFQFYSRAVHARVADRCDKAQRLARALDDNALEQVYQPIVALADRRIVAVEALARWTDTDLGPISPAEFIPLSEEDPGMRYALTHWALDTACRQTAAWRDQLGASIRVGVNIPGAELSRDDFADRVRAALARHGLAANQLTLELTEQGLITHLQAAVATINALRAEGVRFAVDDFGTGYSSLSYLKKLPLDVLKIDRSFVQAILDDPVDHRLTQAIVDIARALELEVVAEGIEAQAQLNALRALRCDCVQGYLLARPEPADAVSRRLAALPRDSKTRALG